jgi:hypothetical protein
MGLALSTAGEAACWGWVIRRNWPGSFHEAMVLVVFLPKNPWLMVFIFFLLCPGGEESPCYWWLCIYSAPTTALYILIWKCL